MSRKDEIRDTLYEMPPHQLVGAWNRYQSAINGTDIIYSMQSDFNNIIASLPPMEIVKLVNKATKSGLFDTYDNYFYYNPECGELYSFDDPDDLEFFNLESLVSYIVSANDDIGIPSLQKILNEPEIPEYEFKFIVKYKGRTDNVAKTMIALKDYIEMQTCGKNMEVAGCDITKVE